MLSVIGWKTTSGAGWMPVIFAVLVSLQAAAWCLADGSYAAVLAGGDAKAQGKDYAGARTQYRHAMTLDVRPWARKYSSEDLFFGISCAEWSGRSMVAPP